MSAVSCHTPSAQRIDDVKCNQEAMKLTARELRAMVHDLQLD